MSGFSGFMIGVIVAVIVVIAMIGAIMAIARTQSGSNADLDEQQQRPRTYGPTSQSPNIRPYSPRGDSPAQRKPVANRPSSGSSADTTPVTSSYPYSPAIFGADAPSGSSRKDADSDSSSTYRETPTSHYSDSDRSDYGSSSSGYSGGGSSDSGSSGSSSSGGDGGGGGGGGE